MATMRFDDALVELRAGKRVKRKAWKTAYMFLGKSVGDDGKFNETLYLGRLESPKIYPVKRLDIGCILGDDWSVVDVYEKDDDGNFKKED